MAVRAPGGRGPSPPARRQAIQGRLSVATIVAMIITLGVGAFGAWGTHSVVRDQQKRLLNERASEVGLLFTSAIGGITSSLTATRGVVHATNGSASAFASAVDDQVLAGASTKTTLALLAPAPAASGSSPWPGRCCRSGRSSRVTGRPR